MNIGIVTNIRAPYRTLQFNEFSRIRNVNINVYYTNKKIDNRKWEMVSDIKFTESDLKGFKVSNRYGYINRGIMKIVKDNDLIILGSYEQPTMIFLSLICRILNKPYVLLYDGISCDRLNIKEHNIKKFIKSIVINNSDAIMGNGIISKEYFSKVFKYTEEKIFNQYLTVDIKKINELYKKRLYYRNKIRDKFGIADNQKVLIYSGRVIELKNIESVIEALSRIKDSNLVFLIVGGGPLEEKILNMAKNLKVKVIITGFINIQEELFKYYFAADALILPSRNEVWGLVVNEGMAAGLPVLVSEICGCQKDLVKSGYNGYVFDPYDLEDLSKKINLLINDKRLVEMGKNSKEIIDTWTFENSRISLEAIIEYLNL